MNNRHDDHSIELLDIPADTVHVNDGLPELVAASIPYDEQNWEVAKVQLEPIARTGNRLALFKLANTLDSLGDLIAAEHYWRIAVAGGDANSANNLANLLDDTGRREEAMEFYTVAAEAGLHDAMRNIGLCIEDEDPDGAEEWFLKSVAAGGVQACVNLALKYFDEGFIEEAKKYVELGFERGSLMAVTAEARYYMVAKNWEMTLQASDRALSLASEENLDDQVHPLKLRAIALINLRRFDEAEKAIQNHRLLGIDGANDLANWLSDAREEQAQDVAFNTDADTPSNTLAIFCVECGTRFPDDTSRFCSDCGKPRVVTAGLTAPAARTQIRVPTTFDQKLNILSELWLDHRKEEAFADFVEYNDIGLPLAYAIQNGIVNTTEKATNFIEETFELLLDGLDMEDREGGFDSLDEILEGEED
jgi:tetratricopeptide (TPR) repeat protein